MKRSLILPVIAVAALMCLAACTGNSENPGPDPGPAPAEKVAVLDKTELTLVIGETAELNLTWEEKAAESLSAASAPVEYVWTSDASGIATVEGSDEKATVTAVAEGTAAITVSQGDKALATCVVTVIKMPLAVTVPEEAGLVLRKNAVVTVRAKCAEWLEGNFTWESSDTSIGTVEYQGQIARVKGVARGECTISVHCGDYTASFTLIVGIN